VAGPITLNKEAFTRAVVKKILDTHPETNLDSKTLGECLGDFIEEVIERPEDLLIEAAAEKAIVFLKEVKLISSKRR